VNTCGEFMWCFCRQVIIPVIMFYGGLYASATSKRSTWYRIFPLDESQSKFRSSAHNNKLVRRCAREAHK
jgi:hypothetical protein